MIIEDLVTRYITLYKKKEYERNLSLYGWQLKYANEAIKTNEWVCIIKV